MSPTHPASGPRAARLAVVRVAAALAALAAAPAAAAPHPDAAPPLDAAPQQAAAPDQGTPDRTDSGAPTPAGDAASRGWLLFDEVHLIVNEEIITLNNARRLYERIRSNRPVSTREQALALEQRVMVEQTDNILGHQAGEDLGIPPERIAEQIKTYHRRRMEREGIVKVGEDIRALETDRESYDEGLSSELYRSLWEQRITGRLPGPRGRIAVDRYIRPGSLRYHYDVLQRDPRLLQVIGGTPEQLVFQHLVVAVQPGESEADARERAASLRARAVAGESFDDLVARYSAAPQDRGMAPPVSLAELDNAPQDVRLFARTARVSDLSEPMPIVRDGRLQAFRVLHLVERRPAVVPPFSDQEVQRKLREFIEHGQEELRVHEALDDLYGAAYIWPPEVFEHRPPLPPRISEF